MWNRLGVVKNHCGQSMDGFRPCSIVTPPPWWGPPHGGGQRTGLFQGPKNIEFQSKIGHLWIKLGHHMLYTFAIVIRFKCNIRTSQVFIKFDNFCPGLQIFTHKIRYFQVPKMTKSETLDFSISSLDSAISEKWSKIPLCIKTL